jgi:hypothetical protein
VIEEFLQSGRGKGFIEALVQRKGKFELSAPLYFKVKAATRLKQTTRSWFERDF